MKRVFVLTMVILFAFAMLFTACEKKDTTGPVTLNVMGYGNNSNAEGITWMRIIEDFQKENPDIRINSELLYDEAYHQKVTARLAAGEVPHVAYMGADARWGAAWQEAGQQIDHRSFMNSMYDKDLIPEMGPNGEIYYIPLGTSNICTVLYMNTLLMKELGLSEPETYADIVKMVPKAKAAGVEVVSIDGADGWAWGSCLMSAVVARMSGNPDYVKETVVDGKYSFTSPEWIKSLEFLVRMIDDKVISPKSVLVDYGTNISNFSNGKALFMVQGQWVAGSVENIEVRENMKLMAWPELPGEKSSTAGSVAAAWQVGYGITKAGAADPAIFEAAKKFLDYVNREEETTQRLRDGAIVAPVLDGYVAPDDLPNELKQKVTLAQTAPNTNVIDAYLSGAPNDALNAGMQEIVAGKARPAEVAQKVESLR